MTTVVKKALIREPGHPIGFPAPLYLNCVCGNKVNLGQDKNYICEHCHRKYDAKGYLIEGDNKV